MARAHIRNVLRASGAQVYRRKIECPACGWHLIDSCTSTPIDIVALNEGALPAWEPNFIVRCQRCKNDFAIRQK